jgi:salicylate hydroxylase
VSAPRPILIAGAGIAGLALALALSRRGLPSLLLEKRTELTEAGAGIQLGPNGMRVLERLGVARRLEPAAGKPAAIALLDGQTGRLIAELPLGLFMIERYGAPYWVAHRADLHAALLACVREERSIELLTGFEVAAVTDTGGSVRVDAPGGRSVEGPALIGADGLWSAVRRDLRPGREPHYAGRIAVRTVIDARLAAGRFAEPKTGAWLGQRAHVVHYPIRAGAAIACVIIADEEKPREGWSYPVTRDAALHYVLGYAPGLLRFLELAPDWHAWSLFDCEPLPSWSRGRIGLIGDAAHPMLPFLAQGGAMALEDAATLAEALAAFPHDPASAFRASQAARWRRVARVRAASRANGEVYRMAGLTARLRNLAFGTVPGAVLMRGYGWIYGWRGDALPVTSRE